MSRIEKLIYRLQQVPAPRDLAWNDLRTRLLSYGYREIQGSGSRVKFVNPSLASGKLIMLHKRHPDPTLLKYQIDNVLSILQEAKLL